MYPSLKTNYYVIPRLGLSKKSDQVDKGTTRKTPGNNEGARPPKKEDYEKIQKENNTKDSSEGK